MTRYLERFQMSDIELTKYTEMIKIQLRNGNYAQAKRIIDIVELNSRPENYRGHECNTLSVYELAISQRIAEALERNNINTIAELIERTTIIINGHGNLLLFEGIGIFGMGQIVKAMKKLDITCPLVTFWESRHGRIEDDRDDRNDGGNDGGEPDPCPNSTASIANNIANNIAKNAKNQKSKI